MVITFSISDLLKERTRMHGFTIVDDSQLSHPHNIDVLNLLPRLKWLLTYHAQRRHRHLEPCLNRTRNLFLSNTAHLKHRSVRSSIKSPDYTSRRKHNANRSFSDSNRKSTGSAIRTSSNGRLHLHFLMKEVNWPGVDGNNNLG